MNQWLRTKLEEMQNEAAMQVDAAHIWSQIQFWLLKRDKENKWNAVKPAIPNVLIIDSKYIFDNWCFNIRMLIMTNKWLNVLKSVFKIS